MSKAQATKQRNSSGPLVSRHKGKRKHPDQILGRDPWDVEHDLCIDMDGLDPSTHRALIIIRYMHNGNLRPLLAAIHDGEPLHQDVLDFMASMIKEGRLIAKPRGRGKRFNPSKLPRDYMAAFLYERGDTFQEVANQLGMSVDAVRKAVTHWRKSAK
jgi:hypothetical protein